MSDKKKCGRCKKIKCSSDFYANKCTITGLSCYCKQCCSKLKKNRKYKLTCQNPECGKEFIHNKKSRKNCYCCFPVRKTLSFEECNDEALKYSKRSLFREGSPSEYNKAKKEGWLREILENAGLITGISWTFEECKQEAEKHVYLKSFRENSTSHYKKANKEGWLDKITSHLINQKERITDDEIRERMKKYNSRSELGRQEASTYSKARNKPWYKEYCQEIYGDPIEGGFSKSHFIKACEKNNNGMGKLYLIKCWGNGENFYKIGITSRSVNKRYGRSGSGTKKLSYLYEIIWEIEGDGGQIWEMEKEYHRNTKQYRYQPDLWPGEARECFKCHGNCKILRKPEVP